MPILVHGTLASRERAPRRRTRRVANLWVAAFLGGVAAGRRTHRLLFCPLVLRSNEIWCAVRTVARRQHAATASAPTASVSYSECCSLHAFAAMGHERLQGLEAIVKTAKNVQQTLPQRSAAAAKLELASVLQALAVLGVRTTWGWVQ